MNYTKVLGLASSAIALSGVCSPVFAQDQPAAPGTPATAPAAPSADDFKALRDELAELREELRKMKEEKAGTATSQPGTTPSGTVTPDPAPKPGGTVVPTPKPASPKWYDSINLRGYAQVRYNRLFESNGNYRNEQGDRSIGENGGFFLRRMRLIFSGQVSKKVYFYVQPDFASSASSNSLNFGQIRDAYFDLGLDNKNEHRFRLGQSKIPFGFENMQSSQNRLPLDRADSLNSAFTNERDIGVMYYYAPDKIRKLFASLVSEGLKGSGDYGVVGLGIFNGQTANRPELNNGKHVVGRLSYPFQVGKQIIEPGIQAYSGNFVIPTDQTSAGTILNARRTYTDKRIATSFVLYPKPFGIQAEYNWGKGPEFDTATDTIRTQSLRGGYVTASYLKKIGHHTLIPFTRWQNYQGGKKHELDARSYRVRELEVGVEWQPNKNFELVGEYVWGQRSFVDFARQDNDQRGRMLRLQAQLNF